MWDMHDVIDIIYKADYVYHVVFDDGTAGDIDFTEYLSKGPIFAPLKDQNFLRTQTRRMHMSEVFIGILVIAAFIGFVIWKNKGKAKQEEDIHSQQWWAEREQERKEGPVIVRASSDDKDDSDD